MAQCLTWMALSPTETNECVEAIDLDTLRLILKSIDEAHNGELLYSNERNAGQVNVLLDLYGHVILFGKASQLSPFKINTLFGIVRHVHETSMAGRYSRVDSYDLLRQTVVRHSVHRPPYSMMVFHTGEVQDIDAYLMSTYYRHYKMYYYCFVPREVATLRTVMLNDFAEAPPPHLPSLSTALTEEAWKEKMQETSRQHEASVMDERTSSAAAITTTATTNAMTTPTTAESRLSSVHKMSLVLDGPEFNKGIRHQLGSIRESVSKHSTDRLDVIEAKLAAIEGRVHEMHNADASRTSSRGAAKKKK